MPKPSNLMGNGTRPPRLDKTHNTRANARASSQASMQAQESSPNSQDTVSPPQLNCKRNTLVRKATKARERLSYARKSSQPSQTG